MNHSATATHAFDVPTGRGWRSAEALTLDLLRARQSLGLGAQELARLLGIDAAAAGRLLEHERMVDPASEEGLQAQLLVRLHRAIGDVYGSLELAASWLQADDADLAGRPRELIRTRPGLLRVTRAIEARCKDCRV